MVHGGGTINGITSFTPSAQRFARVLLFGTGTVNIGGALVSVSTVALNPATGELGFYEVVVPPGVTFTTSAGLKGSYVLL